MPNERRTAVRVELVVELYGKTMPMGLPISLVNITPAGMAIRMNLPLPLETRQRFDLQLDDGQPLTLSGEVVHCEPTEDEHFSIGVRFAHPIPELFDRIITPRAV